MSNTESLKNQKDSRPEATPLFLACPVMTFERFSEQTGLRVGQVRAQVTRGNLPGFRVGRLLLVNSAKLLEDHNTLATMPVMTADRFAEASGLRERQVQAQAELNNLPTKYVGRLRLIDVAALTAQCLEQE